jgi:acyl-CoA thioesterase I
MKFFPGVILLLLSTNLAVAAEPADLSKFDLARLRPFWLSEVMDAESVLFVKEHDSAAAEAALLFVPTKILSVQSSSVEVTYEQERDYVWEPGSRTLTLPEGSRIPCQTVQDLRRPAGSQPHRLTHHDGNGEILFGGGHEYHDMQTTITYEHELSPWPGRVPTFSGAQLPHTRARLEAGGPLTIALLGDSISTGCNVSGWAKTAPFQPPFQELFATNLEAVYGSNITLKNFSIGGTDTSWGLQNIGPVIESDPDLLILAFGMNDNPAGRPAHGYQANIGAMIEAVRAVKPDTEFILVATMLGNKDWTYIKPELFSPYRDALKKLCAQGIVLADMTSIWTELFKQKKDWDMTGNGVNHPNDFGHRIYAQVLSTLLIPESKMLQTKGANADPG